MNLINTKFDTNLTPFYTINNGEFLCPLETQTDLDCALLIYDKENQTKKNYKLNIQLFNKKLSDINQSVTTNSTFTSGGGGGGKKSNNSTIDNKPPQLQKLTESKSIEQTPIKINSDASFKKFLDNNNNDNYLSSTNHINDHVVESNENSGGFFIPEEDDNNEVIISFLKVADFIYCFLFLFSCIEKQNILNLMVEAI